MESTSKTNCTWVLATVLCLTVACCIHLYISLASLQQEFSGIQKDLTHCSYSSRQSFLDQTDGVLRSHQWDGSKSMNKDISPEEEGKLHLLQNSGQTFSLPDTSSKTKDNVEDTDSTDSAPGEEEESKGDVIYVQWGRFDCDLSLARPYTDGYATGFSHRGAQSLSCMPASASGSTAASVSVPEAAIPSMTPAIFNLRGVNQLIDSQLNLRPIRCAVCHADRTAMFTIIGTRECNETSKDWVTAYWGYQMTVTPAKDSTYKPTSTICVHHDPILDNTLPTDEGKAPQVTFVKYGKGIGVEDQPIMCAVCARRVKE